MEKISLVMGLNATVVYDKYRHRCVRMMCEELHFDTIKVFPAAPGREFSFFKPDLGTHIEMERNGIVGGLGIPIRFGSPM